MPAPEAREWERFALRGPGPLQILILLSTLTATVSRALGGRLTPRALMPWHDGLLGDPETVAAEREEDRARKRTESLRARAAAAEWG